jgi:hypothetical protein
MNWFYNTVKILATVLLVYVGLYNSVHVASGWSTVINPVVHGTILFAIWFCTPRGINEAK